MKEETLGKIFEFIKEKGKQNLPLFWKLKNDIPLTEEDLNVESDLNFYRLEIKSLPKGLKVGGNLYLTYCGKLTSLPEGLKVGGDLYIHATPLTKYLYDDLRQMVKPGFIKGIIYR